MRVGFAGEPPRDVLLWVKIARDCLSGMSYSYLPETVESARIPREVRLLAVLRIGTRLQFPCSGRYPGLRGAPDYTVRCWQEALVALVAHEELHLRSFKERRASDSELRCERAAVRALRRFRKDHACAADSAAA